YVQSAGTNSVSASMYLGTHGNGTSRGTYTLSGGVLVVGGSEGVGNDGVGIFNQSGGTHIVSNLVLAVNVGSSGAYNMTNGILNSTGTLFGGENIGLNGVGSFVQTGGTHNAQDLVLGSFVN